ncbi:MerR family transcriptional regulator [Bdellovibrio sp. KM01]|uniref:MerR family transcriptional regulator n=1 Tax=Bdellovibrio sp. KM01 TaxID=2748865 RepID=UPI0015EA3AE4|nr:MerR family transcriptional regulator [Bdellovibrio sp. KM01]QLY25492.1 MerR family transcriptional regulator [Bdellovibrio sp. KM01]
MKNWLTIGQFAKEIGVSAKALRLYEEMGLLKSHVRGENGYRYYDEAQLEIARRLREFKDLGFTLSEIKNLLEADIDLDSKKLIQAMQRRSRAIALQAEVLKSQKDQIDEILSSLEMKTGPLAAQQRRAIMNYYGKASILVVGKSDLESTATFISKQFQNSGINIPIYEWSKLENLPEEKPYILILCENDLDKNVKSINADIIVVRSIGGISEDIEKKYLQLFEGVGPHVSTIIHADDAAGLAIARHKQVQKGRIYYVTKNGNLEPQMKKIGGVYSDGEEMKIFGLNWTPLTELKTSRAYSFQEELSLMYSLCAVLHMDLKKDDLFV